MEEEDREIHRLIPLKASQDKCSCECEECLGGNCDDCTCICCDCNGCDCSKKYELGYD